MSKFAIKGLVVLLILFWSFFVLIQTLIQTLTLTPPPNTAMLANTREDHSVWYLLQGKTNIVFFFVLLSTYAYNFTEQKNWVAFSKNVSSTFGVRFELPNVK